MGSYGRMGRNFPQLKEFLHSNYGRIWLARVYGLWFTGERSKVRSLPAHEARYACYGHSAKTAKSVSAGDLPHQFRTRNGLNEMRRTRSNSNENTRKSAIAIIVPPLITVWLQVRVLPGPPKKMHHTDTVKTTRFPFKSGSISL
ncbi:hypothetical protein ACVWY3_007584 [Bradyrhizobium sp. USDA 4486]